MRFYYDYEDPDGHKMMDLQAHKNYRLSTVGDYRELENLLNEQSEEIEKLKLKLHIFENVCYMLDIEVNRAMEEGFAISDWYLDHLAKGGCLY